MSKNIKARWSYSLDCECPKCEKQIDICGHNNYDPVLDSDEPISICENETERTSNYEVQCECGHIFLVDFEY